MFRKPLIRAAFFALRVALISKIKFQPLKSFFERLIQPAEEVADLLTDSNPDNQGQLEAFWAENRDRLEAEGIATAIDIVKAKVQDPVIRDLVVGILEDIQLNGEETLHLAA